MTIDLERTDPERALFMLASLPAATMLEWTLSTSRLEHREMKAIERSTGRSVDVQGDALLDCRLVLRGTAGSHPSLLGPAIAHALGFGSATLSPVANDSVAGLTPTVLLTPDSLVNVLPPPEAVAALAPVFRSPVRLRLPHVPLPSEGLELGRTRDGRVVRQTLEDRMRHRVVIGAPGTGKTCLMTADALAAAESGYGLLLLDPHGDGFEQTLRCLPANRREDLTVIDISKGPPPGVSLNLLECTKVSQIPIRAGQVVELIATQGDPAFFGPMFKQAALNGSTVLGARMEEPGTVADIPRLFLDAAFRREWLANPAIAERAPDAVRWWTEGYSKYSDFTRSEQMDYYISKFNLFATDPVLRSILGSPRSTIDLRGVMDGRGILLCNFGRGGANPLATTLLTAVFMQAVFNAALSRSDVHPSRRTPFFVFCDEFQRVAGPSTGAMVAELRKYAIALNFALQYLDALPSETLAAVVGTVATKVLFRLGARDASRMVEFMPDLTVKELARLPNFVAVVELLTGGAPMEPFNVLTPRPADLERNGTRF